MEKSVQYVRRVRSELDALRRAIEAFPDDESEKLVRMAVVVAEAIRAGRVVYACGNGGSAADAQHIVGELVGRFRHKARGYKAFALTTNSSVVTALANDFSFDEVFSRQIESCGAGGDVLLALSTSGDSPNVLRAVDEAKRLGLRTLAFSGKGGGALAAAAELAVVVRHDDFARIQEVHMALGHILCGLVEEMIAPRP